MWNLTTSSLNASPWIVAKLSKDMLHQDENDLYSTNKIIITCNNYSCQDALVLIIWIGKQLMYLP